jgi:hypothetical protein
MNLREKKTPGASQHDLGWIVQRTKSLSPVAEEIFLLTIPFIERAYRTSGFPPDHPKPFLAKIMWGHVQMQIPGAPSRLLGHTPVPSFVPTLELTAMNRSDMRSR